jgi:hypothetical protein
LTRKAFLISNEVTIGSIVSRQYQRNRLASQ